MTITRRMSHSSENARKESVRRENTRRERKAHKARKTRKARHATRRSPPKYQPTPRPKALVEPPAPPIELTPLVACSADTAQDVLWHIAEYAPKLRKWLVANPSATPSMLEYLAQVGGPGVPEALRTLLKSLDERESRRN